MSGDRDSLRSLAAGGRVGLSQRQWDLLRTIVDNYVLRNSAEFYLTQNSDGWWITYSSGPFFRVIYGDLDELCRQELVRLKPSSNSSRGWPTELGIQTAHSRMLAHDEERPLAPVADPSFWRCRREEFESLQGGDYSLSWSTRPPIGLDGSPAASHWNWFHYPDASFRARLTAIALKCAKAFGRDSEDGWFDALREADFVGFKLTGNGQYTTKDGTVANYEGGVLRDVVKHSITQCHVLEAAASTHQELGPAASTNDVDSAKELRKADKTPLGRNIDRFRKECGWSFDELAKAAEIDKKLILGHVNHGRGAHPSTLQTYALTFSQKLGREITVEQLES